MTGFLNLSFETVDIDGVSPASWTFSGSTAVELIDQFFSGGVLEGFERGWNSNESFERALVIPTNAAELAFTNPVTTLPITQEGFEVGWDQNENYEHALGPDAADAFVGTGTQETFESGWHSNETFEFTSFGSSSADVFVGAITKETFESGWLPAAYETSIVVGTNATANVWDGARTSAKETFEFVQPDLPVTHVDTTGAGYIYPSAVNTIAVGYTVEFYSVTGQLPNPLAAGTQYSVASSASFGTVLTVDLGGLLAAPTNAGTGLFYVTDPYEYWTTVVTL
jgi:hypothetical protein